MEIEEMEFITDTSRNETKRGYGLHDDSLCRVVEAIQYHVFRTYLF